RGDGGTPARALPRKHADPATARNKPMQPCLVALVRPQMAQLIRSNDSGTPRRRAALGGRPSVRQSSLMNLYARVSSYRCYFLLRCKGLQLAQSYRIQHCNDWAMDHSSSPASSAVSTGVLPLPSLWRGAFRESAGLCSSTPETDTVVGLRDRALI